MSVSDWLFSQVKVWFFLVASGHDKSRTFCLGERLN